MATKATLKEGSFFVVQSFMRTELNLEGSKLLVYAIVYGFSQDGKSCFEGSIAYLSEWTGYSESTVRRSLHDLVEDGLIMKLPSRNDGKSPNKYRTTCKGCQNATPVNLKPQGCHSATPGGVMVTPNNIDNKIEDNLDILSSSDELDCVPQKKVYPYDEIIGYLNEKADRHYSSKATSARKHIRARINEGFTVEDFKTVIDKMCSEWKDDPQWDMYLRPDTLFNSKFDSYLQRKINLKSGGSNDPDRFAAYNF